MGYRHINSVLLDLDFSIKNHIKKLNILIKNQKQIKKRNSTKSHMQDILVENMNHG